MSRWRRYSTATWDRPWFRALSAAPPNAQTLYNYLVTGPATTAIPGLILAGEAALSEALRWPLPGFRRSFRELEAQGVARADWSARIIWVQSLLEDAAPESPNSARAWRTALDEIPPCELAEEVRGAVTMLVEGLTEPFRKAFAEGSRKTSRKVFANKSAVEGSRKKEQEQDSPLSPTRTPGTGVPEPERNGHDPIPPISRHVDPWRGRRTAGGAS